jgi:hypothetical protein
VRKDEEKSMTSIVAAQKWDGSVLSSGTYMPRLLEEGRGEEAIELLLGAGQFQGATASYLCGT